ncbi:hypothetical protein FP2506_14274 [Fulvimarina pelagi HTCC2506]|uniref:Uncharacterized protein n=1 Tax=Fulvimarina pelagi HTCC2506 TaxID=314231 RepID=Q0G475_9HYPH|nr:hypothetical protein FP2506_14274 [Fulvimarina pelagi HTCC2506]
MFAANSCVGVRRIGLELLEAKRPTSHAMIRSSMLVEAGCRRTKA